MDVRCTAIRSLLSQVTLHSDLTTGLLLLCATPVSDATADSYLAVDALPTSNLVNPALLPARYIVRGKCPCLRVLKHSTLLLHRFWG